MAKMFKCDDVVPGRKIIVEGRDELEVVAKEPEYVAFCCPWSAAVADRVELSY